MKRLYLILLLIIVPNLINADIKKIGVIDLQKVLQKSKRGQAAKKSLEKIADEKKSTLDKRKEEIEKLTTDIERQSLVLSEEAKKNKEKELNQKKQDFLQMLQTSQDELQKKDQELTQGILKELEKILYKIGKTEGYDLIIEKNEGGLLYSPEEFDITDKVIKEYDKQAGN